MRKPFTDWLTISVGVQPELKASILDYAEKVNAPSLSSAIRDLIETGLRTKTLKAPIRAQFPEAQVQKVREALTEMFGPWEDEPCETCGTWNPNAAHQVQHEIKGEK